MIRIALVVDVDHPDLTVEKAQKAAKQLVTTGPGWLDGWFQKTVDTVAKGTLTPENSQLSGKFTIITANAQEV